ncbi:hypothetical protein C0Q70_11827 [Pomacea canaliculata]|uniref:Uncharacterized protein n=1 Tax=Pomacea canaliculata TaxID=400727 RepID=A0A2T7P728_POMCA|nr:hypothetical protein C0Q70_11827 [Pomacea canaliculata]
MAAPTSSVAIAAANGDIMVTAECNQCNRGTLWTPLHCATFQGHGKVIMHLLDYPVDMLAKDSQGRTPVDFASAIDAIWPFFEVAGCRQTSKADLIKMDIIKKILPTDPFPIKTDLLSLTQPGSAYVFNTDSLLNNRSDTTKAMAAAAGDVLAGDEDVHNVYSKPYSGMSIWHS